MPRLLKFPLPIIPELSPLVDALTSRGVDVYLSGWLGDNKLLFVDICWEVAERLQGRLPAGWTLIYAYFVSSEAVCSGKPDPLLSGVQISSIIKSYRPKGFTDLEFQENKEALIEQAEYLMQFPPSRLVFLSGAPIAPSDVDALVGLL